MTISFNEISPPQISDPHNTKFNTIAMNEMDNFFNWSQLFEHIYNSNLTIKYLFAVFIFIVIHVSLRGKFLWRNCVDDIMSLTETGKNIWRGLEELEGSSLRHINPCWRRPDAPRQYTKYSASSTNQFQYTLIIKQILFRKTVGNSFVVRVGV